MSRQDESLYLGAYWGDRVEDADSCAERLARCLGAVAAVSPYLDGWRPKGRSLSGARVSPIMELDGLIDLLRAGANRRDSDGSVIEELGMRWSGWNGNTSMGVSVSVTCGAAATQKGVLNSFVLKLPEFARPGAQGIYGRAHEVIAGVVEAWQPDWAVLTSHELRESLDLVAEQPVVGWFTYLGPGRDAGKLGEGLGAGTIIRVGDWERLATSDVSKVATALVQTGALAPVGS